MLEKLLSAYPGQRKSLSDSTKKTYGDQKKQLVIASEHQERCNWVAELASRRGIIAAHQEAVASPPIVHRVEPTGSKQDLLNLPCKAASINHIPTASPAHSS